MKRPPEVLRGAVTASRERLWAIGSQSERTLMLGTILLASVISAATAYALSQWYAVDVFSTLLVVPGDCWLDWGMNIGRHCFSDYAMVAAAGIQPNPADYLISLPADYQPTAVAAWAPARIPYAIFGLPSHWLGAPRLGLICYLVALTMAVISPAIWAARGGTWSGASGHLRDTGRRGHPGVGGSSIEATRQGSWYRSRWLTSWRCPDSGGASPPSR